MKACADSTTICSLLGALRLGPLGSTPDSPFHLTIIRRSKILQETLWMARG